MSINIKMNKLLSILALVVFGLVILSCSSRNRQSSTESTKSTNSISQLIIPEIPKEKNADTLGGSIILMTWNIQDLGKTKDSTEIHFIARVINQSDVTAVQEVVAKDPRGAQTVAKIADELNRMGSRWDYSVSDPTHSPSSKMSERYAFFWRTSEVNFLKKARLDTALREKCVREPFVGHFVAKKSETPFQIVNFHSVPYNKEPEKEIIHFMDYPQRLNSDLVIIAGDFNLDENHMVWYDLYNQGYQPAVLNTPTTLKKRCKKGAYKSHIIDNIYYPSNQVKKINSGLMDYINDCKNLKNARAISDHLPVYMELSFN